MSKPNLKRIIDRAELDEMIPYTLEHIRRLEKTGHFPQRLQLGSNRVGWLLSEVEEWIDERARARVKPGSDEACDEV
ncbi:MAG: AlpA family phage regulatory protein [Rhizobiales bacterium]|nr:AlpA family phage regulatory protein [Hyphomicrobiales bacterium]